MTVIPTISNDNTLALTQCLNSRLLRPKIFGEIACSSVINQSFGHSRSFDFLANGSAILPKFDEYFAIFTKKHEAKFKYLANDDTFSLKIKYRQG